MLINKHLAVICSVAALTACGGTTVWVADAKNSRECPTADASNQSGVPCNTLDVSCDYDGPSRPCGAGRSSTYTLVCRSGDPVDAGAAWVLLGCL